MPQPPTAATVEALKPIVLDRARDLRASGELPEATQSGVYAWEICGTRGVRVWMDIPAILLHGAAARARRDRIIELCTVLTDEFRALIGKHQTDPPFDASVTIAYQQHTYGAS